MSSNCWEQLVECREFISPLLHAAVLIACKIHPEFQRSVHGLRLFPELTVTGRHGIGPIDYILKYRQFMIVVAEVCIDCTCWVIIWKLWCGVFNVCLVGNIGKETCTGTCTRSAHCANCKRPGHFLAATGPGQEWLQKTVTFWGQPCKLDFITNVLA